MHERLDDSLLGCQPLRALLLHRDMAFHAGVPKSILYFTQHRDPQRIHVTVASCKDPSSEMSEALRNFSSDCVGIGDGGYAAPAARLRSLLKQERIQIAVCTSFKCYVLAKMACIGLPCRVAFWVPGLPLVLDGRVKRFIYRLLSKDDLLVFISQAVRQAHLPPRHRGPSPVIYYGVPDPLGQPDDAPYERAVRSTLDLPPDALVLCFTAEFVGWKDHATLLKAFAQLDSQLNAHLLLIGTGQLIDHMKQLAEQLHCAQRIRFAGARRDARRLLGLVDIYVHPSRGEGLGLAVVEAMLAGKPVIAAREGALPEYVIDGRTGLLFEPGDADDLQARIEQMAMDPGRAQQLARAGRELCLELFAPPRFAEELSGALEAAAGATKDRRGLCAARA